MAPENIAPDMKAKLKLAFVRFAIEKFVLNASAWENEALSAFTFDITVPAREAPLKYAPTKLAPSK